MFVRCEHTGVQRANQTSSFWSYTLPSCSSTSTSHSILLHLFYTLYNSPKHLTAWSWPRRGQSCTRNNTKTLSGSKKDKYWLEGKLAGEMSKLHHFLFCSAACKLKNKSDVKLLIFSLCSTVVNITAHDGKHRFKSVLLWVSEHVLLWLFLSIFLSLGPVSSKTFYHHNAPNKPSVKANQNQKPHIIKANLRPQTWQLWCTCS